MVRSTQLLVGCINPPPPRTSPLGDPQKTAEEGCHPKRKRASDIPLNYVMKTMGWGDVGDVVPFRGLVTLGAPPPTGAQIENLNTLNKLGIRR